MKAQARRISVAVRLRPCLGAEQGQEGVWSVNSAKSSVLDERTGDQWTFDHVFGPDTDGKQLFELSCKEAVEAFCRGVHGAVLAYGQTAAGKTHSMYGPGGVVERAVETVFGLMAAAPERQFSLRAAVLEVYNEQVTDLLGEAEVHLLESQRSDALEGQRSHLRLQNLSWTTVTSLEQVRDCIAKGERRRRSGETAANRRSSRSHGLLMLELESRVKCEESVQHSRLILADLAGSEGLRNSEASSKEQRREGSCINRSLLALTQVIQKLSETGQCANYRDSKLTRILRPALGGNAQTVLLCALAPGEAARHETRSTLDFAARARCVENSVSVNIKQSPVRADVQYQAIQRELRAELRSPRDESQTVRVEELKLKAEAIQAAHVGCNEDVLASVARPCLHKWQRRTLPKVAVSEQPPQPAELRIAEAVLAAASKASPSRLRQPGWRSQKARRSREEARPSSFFGQSQVFPPPSMPGLMAELAPMPLSEAAAEPVVAAELLCREAQCFRRSASSAPSKALPTPRRVRQAQSWEFPLTQAEKHARLIQLFTQELSCVQEQGQLDSSDEEKEGSALVPSPVGMSKMSPVPGEYKFTKEEIWQVLKHEGCGACSVQ